MRARQNSVSSSDVNVPALNAWFKSRDRGILEIDDTLRQCRRQRQDEHRQTGRNYTYCCHRAASHQRARPTKATKDTTIVWLIR